MKSKEKKKKGNGAKIKIIIIEKKDVEVSHCWKNLQILTYVIVLISGIATAKSFGDVLYMFNNHCIFNATLNTILDVNGTRWISSDSLDTRWGLPSDCDFTLFLPVASTAVAGSLACFFAMCGRGISQDSSRHLPQPWRMVPIAFLFNFIFVIISCVHVSYVFDGFSLFCQNIHPVDKRSKIESCEDLWHANVGSAKGDYDLNVNVKTAQVFSVFSLVGWILSFVVIVIRCATHADFHVMAKRVENPPPPSKSHRSKSKKLESSESEPLISSDSIEFSTPLTSINY